MSKRLLAFFLATTLVAIFPLTAISAPEPIGSGFKSTFPPDRSLAYFSNLAPASANANYLGVSWDSSARIQMLPFISVEKKVTGITFRERHLCTGLEDPSCAIDQGWDSAYINSTIGNCAVNPDSACVASFSVVTADGKEIKATPLARFPVNYAEFAGGKLSNGGYLAPGLTPWLWRATGESSNAENDYLLTGVISSGASSTSGNQKATSWKPLPQSFYFEIIPVTRELSALIKAPVRSERKESANGIAYTDIAFTNSESDCIANDLGVCLHRREFVAGAKFKVTLQLPNNISGWLNGRLFNPKASVTVKDSDLDLLEIEAAPLQNIMGGAYVPKSTISSSDWAWTAEVTGPGSTSVSAANRMKNGESAFYVGDSGEYGALNWFKAWSKYFGDKAVRVNNTWTIQTTQAESTGGCVKAGAGLQGIVSTNASVYDSGAPSEDKATSTLTYRVAAPVNDPSGKPNAGVYALSMNSALLKCLYSIESVPSQAQIVITNASGNSVVQTAALNTQNGWVNFSASNFEFSDLSLLQVKISQPTPTPTPTPTPSVSSSATSKSSDGKVAPIIKKTITCVKGSSKKKVTAQNPKCPAGYKKLS